jgi:2-polyprenyl-3-methyl-5-hydroxy-6-metoxy-1,4-benzoquinol methylase
MKKFNKNPGTFKASIAEKFPQVVSLFYSCVYRQRRKTLRRLSIKEVFTKIAGDGGWGNSESLSGPGSTVADTHEVRSKICLLLKELKVRTLLDIPCGDFNWIDEIDFGQVEYIGADIVDDLIARNRKCFTNSGQYQRTFSVLDITEDELPKVDLILCRDCLVHFSKSNINRAIKNMIKSNAKYLLTTTYPLVKKNIDIVTGEWRPLNLQLPPFNFPTSS